MAYTTPRTWATNDAISAARLNQDLRDNVSFLATPPSCRVYKSGALAHAGGGTEYVTFTLERFDTDTMHDPSSNTSRITAKTAGKYLIGGHVEFAAGVTGQRGLSIRHQGATTIAAHLYDATASGVCQASISTFYALAINEYVELGVYSNSALNANASNNYSIEFWAVWQSL